MNKHKFKKKKGLATLVIKGQKNQQLMEREVYGINQEEKVPHLLHKGVTHRGAAIDLTYDLTGYISLREYLQAPLSRASFIALLQHILDILKKMKEHVYNQNCLILDPEFVMINPASKSVYLVFVPLQPFENSTTLRELLLSIVQYATFVGDEDSSYIRDYIRILNTGINFSSFELEQYVDQMPGRQSSGEMFVECPHCHIRLKKTASYCGNCGTKLSGQSGPLNRTVYDPIMEDRQTPAEPPRPDPRPAPPVPPSAKGETGSLSSTSGATTVLGVTNGTTVLGGAEPLPQYPYLIREKDGTRTTVDKPSFRIGKEGRYCDLFLYDNTAISRSHADIVTRDGRYFVVDRNSTNHTYVEGRLIPPEREVELYDNTHLRLANENFTFHLK